MEREEIPCSDLPRQVPGSNLYWSVWVCFLASLNVSFRWKAAQAMQFAQAQEEEERKRVEGTDGQALENQEDDDDDDDDVWGEWTKSVPVGRLFWAHLKLRQNHYVQWQAWSVNFDRLIGKAVFFVLFSRIVSLGAYGVL